MALLFLILAAVVVVVPALGLEVLAVAETAVSHLVMFQHLGQPTQAAVVVVTHRAAHQVMVVLALLSCVIQTLTQSQ